MSLSVEREGPEGIPIESRSHVAGRSRLVPGERREFEESMLGPVRQQAEDVYPFGEPRQPVARADRAWGSASCVERRRAEAILFGTNPGLDGLLGVTQALEREQPVSS